MPERKQRELLAVLVGLGLAGVLVGVLGGSRAPVAAPVTAATCATCTYQLIPLPGCPAGCPAPGTCLTLTAA